jgi:uncharacterized membrane protein
MSRTFCINKRSPLFHFYITLPLVRSILAKICTLFGKSLSLVFLLWFLLTIGGISSASLLLVAASLSDLHT